MTLEELEPTVSETSEPTGVEPETEIIPKEAPVEETVAEVVTVEEAALEEVVSEEVPGEEIPAEEAPAMEELTASEEAPAPEAEEEISEEPVAVIPPVETPAEPAAKKAAKKRRKPHILLRIPLQLLSFVLTFVLFAVVIAGVLLLDLRYLTSSGGIKQLIDTAISSFLENPSHVVPTPQRPVLTVTPMGDVTFPEGDFTVPGGGEIVIPDGIFGEGGVNLGDIPSDIITGGDSGALVDWIYEKVEEQVGEELPFTKEEIGEFVEESTVSDYLSEKIADYADDFLNGTENAVITVDELMNLVEENEVLLKEKLNVELTPELKEQINVAVEKVVVEQDINSTIRDTVYTTVDEVLKETTGSMGVSMEMLQGYLKILNSDLLLYAVIGIAVFVLLLLCLLNFYNVPAGLTWASLPCINAGLILSAPILLLQTSKDLIVSLLPEAGVFVDLAASYVTIFAPFHYGLLAIGLGLLVLSVLWRIIRAILRKRRAVAV